MKWSVSRFPLTTSLRNKIYQDDGHNSVTASPSLHVTSSRSEKGNETKSPTGIKWPCATHYRGLPFLFLFGDTNCNE